MAILSVKDLTKIYDNYDSKTIALNNVSFDVEQGDLVAIVGTSGSGKSTLLHLIGGVDTPTSGNVFIDGQDICSLTKNQLAAFRRQRVGLIYQSYNLLPMLNVRQNIVLPINLDGRKYDEQKLLNIMKLLGIAEKEFHYPNMLSGGQQQRVAIARALMTSPSILLADEPTGNLDSKNSQEIIDLFKKSNVELGQTIIIVTHDMQVANQCKRIIEISDGVIIKNERKF